MIFWAGIFIMLGLGTVGAGLKEIAEAVRNLAYKVGTLAKDEK